MAFKDSLLGIFSLTFLTMHKGKSNITRFRVNSNKKVIENDEVAIEEPLQIDLLQNKQMQTYSITMRTPGHDRFLTYGLLFSEGVINCAEDIDSVKFSKMDSVIVANQVEVEFLSSFNLDIRDQARRLASYSGCGICGKTSMKALSLKNPRAQRKIHVDITCADIVKIREQLAEQTLFSDTGGSHVAGVVYEVEMNGQYALDFDSTTYFEDIGRHNALDKLIGSELIDNNLSQSGIVILSGRVGFELVQKIVMAGFSTIIALGAPSSLAIKTANQFGLSLIGFAKNEQFNLYTF